MVERFKYFVIFAEMRTGSNYLEENLNSFKGIQCLGEVFNPKFVAYPNQRDLNGFDLAARDADPLRLLKTITDGGKPISGFRFFHDHDQRVLEQVLSDKACAKVILSRNPVDSYLSRKAAKATGQWRLGDLKNAKSTSVSFDADEFRDQLATHGAFQDRIREGLQHSGQTAFRVRYEDLSEVAVMNGLAAFLGVHETIEKVSRKTKKQNPQPVADRVRNFAKMKSALAELDPFGLEVEQVFEPGRGAMIPRYVAAAKSPVLYMPIRTSGGDPMPAWLADLDGVGEDDLNRGFSQKTLRQWKRQSNNHSSFTVVRHPVVRLFDSFVHHILAPGPQCYTEIRETLRTSYEISMPDADRVDLTDVAAVRAAFLGFAKFISGNLNGQTSIRIDPAWASQTAVVQGFAEFMPPSVIIREADLESGLEHIAALAGKLSPRIRTDDEITLLALDRVYDAEIEKAVRTAYQRDYMMFGFGPWRKTG